MSVGMIYNIREEIRALRESTLYKNILGATMYDEQLGMERNRDLAANAYPLH